MYRTTLQDGLVKKASRSGNSKERRRAHSPGGFPKDRHVLGVASKGLYVLANPVESCDLIADAKICLGTLSGTGDTLPVEESEGAESVVDRDDDGVAEVSQPASVVDPRRSRSQDKRAAVDPNHDRTPPPIAGGRPYVQVETVLALLAAGGPDYGADDPVDGADLWRRGTESFRLAGALPRGGRFGRTKTKVANRRTSKGNSFEPHHFLATITFESALSSRNDTSQAIPIRGTWMLPNSGVG